MRQMTLAIIKPDAFVRGHCGEIITMIERAGFQILAMKVMKLPLEEAESFYEAHRGRDYFERHTTFMASGPIIAMVLEGDNVINGWRELMGDTDPEKARLGTIRRTFGTPISEWHHSSNRNCTHGSDSPENASREIDFFFSEEN